MILLFLHFQVNVLQLIIKKNINVVILQTRCTLYYKNTLYPSVCGSYSTSVLAFTHIPVCVNISNLVTTSSTQIMNNMTSAFAAPTSSMNVHSLFIITDIMTNIFQYLDFQSLVSCGKVNSWFRKDAFQPSAIYHCNLDDIKRIFENEKQHEKQRFHLSRFRKSKSITVNISGTNCSEYHCDVTNIMTSAISLSKHCGSINRVVFGIDSDKGKCLNYSHLASKCIDTSFQLLDWSNQTVSIEIHHTHHDSKNPKSKPKPQTQQDENDTKQSATRAAAASRTRQRLRDRKKRRECKTKDNINNKTKYTINPKNKKKRATVVIDNCHPQRKATRKRKTIKKSKQAKNKQESENDKNEKNSKENGNDDVFNIQPRYMFNMKSIVNDHLPLQRARLNVNLRIITNSKYYTSALFCRSVNIWIESLLQTKLPTVCFAPNAFDPMKLQEWRFGSTVDEEVFKICINSLRFGYESLFGGKLTPIHFDNLKKFEFIICDNKLESTVNDGNSDLESLSSFNSNLIPYFSSLVYYADEMECIYNFAKAVLIRSPNCSINGFYFLFEEYECGAIKWQNVSFNLAKSTKLVRCITVLHDMYDLRYLGCTLCFNIENRHESNGFVRAPLCARWIQLIIIAMKNVFENHQSSMMESQEIFTYDEVLKINNNVNDSKILQLMWFNERIRLVSIQTTNAICLKIVLNPIDIC